MIFFLGIIFLVSIIFFVDWLSAKNKKELNKKINLIIIFLSILIGIILLIGGLYLYSPLFFSIAAWFLRKKIIFDVLLNIFRKKQKSNQNDYNQKMSLNESYKLLGIDENASKEVIIKSHKELIRKLHPDKGGSSYLSAKVNEARDIILADKEKREQNG
tara:strand:+ start:366 stop:842 length:477 start_codon:yes stop_codon:yes gene_type:complete